jgi:hypothetical protein
LFAPGGRSLVAVSREHLFEKSVATRTPKSMQPGRGGQMRMSVDFGDLVNSERVCLPEGSGAQILASGPGNLVLFAERRCSTSGVSLSGSERQVAPASVYGVNAYAIAYDITSNALVATDRAGFLTIYRIPHPAIAK